MENITEIECTRCHSSILLRDGAVRRNYCASCKSDLRTNWANKLTSDRKIKTLKKREIETLK